MHAFSPSKLFPKLGTQGHQETEEKQQKYIFSMKLLLRVIVKHVAEIDFSQLTSPILFRRNIGSLSCTDSK